MGFKKAVRKLNCLGKEVKGRHDYKLETKLQCLKKKHSQAVEERSRDKSYKERWKHKFPGANIYREEEDLQLLLEQVDIEFQQQQALAIGNVSLDNNEQSLLKYPPGTAVLADLDDFDFKSGQEQMNNKLR